MKNKILLIPVFVSTIAASGYIGWYLGLRDGVSFANSEAAMAMKSYHVAHAAGDPGTAHRVIDRYTELVVCYLLDGRHSLPLYNTFPYRSDKGLADLRAAWKSPERPFDRGLSYPYRPSYRDYRAAFEAVKPAADVKVAPRFAQ